MKSSILALMASAAALASAQVTYNDTTGEFVCAKGGVSYCAGDSLATDIIIRCSEDGVGQPGRCSDNLDGEPPQGDYPALCWQSTNSSGDAACEKNCVVYASSEFTLPTSLCEPTYTASSAASSTPASTSVETTTTEPAVSTTTSCPPTLSTGATGSGSSSGNGTATSTQPSSKSSSKTPVGPTSVTSTATATSTSSAVTAGAAVNNAGSFLAGVGFLAAYLL